MLGRSACTAHDQRKPRAIFSAVHQTCVTCQKCRGAAQCRRSAWWGRPSLHSGWNRRTPDLSLRGSACRARQVASAGSPEYRGRQPGTDQHQQSVMLSPFQIQQFRSETQNFGAKAPGQLLEHAIQDSPRRQADCQFQQGTDQACDGPGGETVQTGNGFSCRWWGDSRLNPLWNLHLTCQPPEPGRFRHTLTQARVCPVEL